MPEDCEHDWSVYDTQAEDLNNEVIGRHTYPCDIEIEAKCSKCGLKASRKGLVQWEEWEAF